MSTNLYLSDTHFGHINIIRYCSRPFRSVAEMDGVLLENMREAERTGARLFHLGDLGFRIPEFVRSRGGLVRPQDHTIIAGNHDQLKPARIEERRAAYALFGKIVGTEKTWKSNTLMVEDVLDGRQVRLLLSHRPQDDLQGADFNLFGHVHNDQVRTPERFREAYPFVDDRYVCVSVEMTDYRPISLAAALGRPHARGMP